MDQKAVFSNVVVAVVTAVVLAVLAAVMGVFEKGAAAINDAQIEAVIERVLVRDNGATYAASLASIDGTLIAIDTKVGIIQKDVNDLERSVLDLASE